VFLFGSILTLVMVAIWTDMGPESLGVVVVVNVLLFTGIFSRMIPAQALVSAIPEVTKRGAFNAISASLQQLAGGVGAAVAGAVIVQAPNGALLHFNWVGYIVITTTLLSLLLMYFVHQAVPEPH
jgi:hypothetical protein